MKRLVCAVLMILVSPWCLSAADTSSVKVEVLAKTGMSWDGRELPGYPGGKPEITVLRIRIPPGSYLPVHKHPVINAGVLLAGELTVVTEDGQVLHLKAGDSLVEVVNTWHYGKNEGHSTAEIIVFYAGAAGNPITVTEQDRADDRQKDHAGADVEANE